MADLAHQQLVTAWIQAGAAIVQAAGAIGAIAVSIQLARSSGKRERRAEESAARRADEADRRAAERIQAADRAAIRRDDVERVVRHNSIVDRLSARAMQENG